MKTTDWLNERKGEEAGNEWETEVEEVDGETGGQGALLNIEEIWRRRHGLGYCRTGVLLKPLVSNGGKGKRKRPVPVPVPVPAGLGGLAR